MKIWLLIFLLLCQLFNPSAAAATRALDDLEKGIFDHPTQVAREAAALLHSGTLDPTSHSRALALSLITSNDPAALSALDAELTRARGRQDWAGTAYLLMRKIVIQRTALNPEAMVAMIEEANHAAEQAGNPHLRALVWHEEAEYYGSRVQIVQALAVINKALDFLTAQNMTETPLYHATRDGLAGNIYYNGQVNDAIKIWLECAAFFERAKQRYVLAISYYNLAFAGGKLYPDRVRGWYQSSLKLAEETESIDMIAGAYFGLGFLARQDKDLTTARGYLQKAYEMRLAKKDYEFAAVCAFELISMAIEQNDFSAADRLLREIEGNIAAGFLGHQENVFRLRSKLYKKSGDLPKALLNLEKEYEAFQNRKRQEEGAQLQKLSSELGLKVEEARNKTLAQELKEAQRFRTFVIILSGLLFGIILLLSMLSRQHRRVRESRAGMQLILDNVDEGLFILDAHGRIGRQTSQRLQSIFRTDKDFAGTQVTDTVFGHSLISGEERSMIQEVLNVCMREDQLAWEMNAANLPQEMQLNDGATIVTLRWIPIFDKQARLQKVLVCLHDVSESRELELANAHQKRHLKALPETLQEMLRGDPKRIESLLQETDRVIHRVQDQSSRLDIMRQLHTEKGIARTLGLKALSHELHDLESSLQDTTWHGGASASVDKMVRGIDERLLEYRAMLKIMAPLQSKGERFPWLGEILNAHLITWNHFLEQAKFSLQGLHIDDQVLHWNPEDQSVAEELCLHSINNSLEHGFIFPRQRGEKVDDPELHISTGRQGDRMWLEIRDNGAGLNRSRLESIAKDRGFTPKGDQTVWDVVFFDGVSTAEQVTLSSGRGVGLSAIRSRVESRGGHVRIQPGESRGTLLRAEWQAMGNQTIL